MSSTYDDLFAYRTAAAKIIEDCGHIAVDSYAAGPRPTPEQCLRDVESCNVLVGIIGLRSGWAPQDGDPRSMTHREFDQAERKTRLMFLLSDKIVDLEDKNKEFRQKVTTQAHPLSVDSLDSFTAGLRKTIKDRIGVAEPISPLLPFLCDRRAQWERVDDCLWQRRQSADTRLRLFLVHADVLQSGAEFVDALRYKLRSFGATKDLGEAISFELAWPGGFTNTETFRYRLQRELALQTVGNRNAEPAEVEQFLQKTSGPIVVQTYLSTTDYEQAGQIALTEFCRFWEGWHQLRRAHPILVVLRVEYELVRNRHAPCQACGDDSPGARPGNVIEIIAERQPCAFLDHAFDVFEDAQGDQPADPTPIECQHFPRLTFGISGKDRFHGKE